MKKKALQVKTLRLYQAFASDEHGIAQLTHLASPVGPHRAIPHLQQCYSFFSSTVGPARVDFRAILIAFRQYPHPAYECALDHAIPGEKDKAFESLEAA